MMRFLSTAVLGAALSAVAVAQVPSNVTWVRVVHAASDAPAVDVLANGNVVFQGLTFKGYTDYTPVPPGTYTFTVNLTGTATTVIASGAINLQGGSAYTFYAMGTVAKGNLILIGTGDVVNAPGPGSSLIRVIHAASTAPTVDVYATAPYAPLASPLLTGVPFTAASPQVVVPAGDYQARVTPAGTKTVAIDSGRLTLTGGTVRTVVALDPSTPGGPFQLMVLNDVN